MNGNVIAIDLGYSFNQPINNLPKSLTHLTLNNFDQSIKKFSDSIFFTGTTDNKKINVYDKHGTIIKIGI